MLNLVASKWWLFALRGVLAILFGVLAFVRPGVTLIALVALFGVYALIDGIVSLAGALTVTGSRFFWRLLLEGIVGIAAGVLTFMRPGITALSLLLVLGVWLVVGGIIRIVSAIELRKEIHHEWLYILGGIASVIAGVLTFWGPFQSALAWVWVMGMYAVIFGFMSIGLGFRLRRFGSSGDVSGRYAAG